MILLNSHLYFWDVSVNGHTLCVHMMIPINKESKRKGHHDLKEGHECDDIDSKVTRRIISFCY